MEPNVPDGNVYLANAVNILSVVAREPPEMTTRRIRFHNRDVLSVRNIETGEQGSIALKLASRQVSELKNLVAYSACSERDPRPHFDTLLRIGRKMVERYRFGHTFPGSFGFTIESPPIGKPTVYALPSSVPEQISLIPEEELPRVPPFGRRVMERIVRGLKATQQATREGDVSVLVKSYPSGFNSRMCAAIVRMARDKALPIEYTVLWSPRVVPGDDVADPGPIRLSETSYLYLEEAEQLLRKLEPRTVVVRGLVISLRSKDDPLEAGSARSVVINWINRERGERPVGIVVPLEREDYVKASEAHLNWQTVEVTGVAEKVGNVWRLLEPRDFRVIGTKGATATQRELFPPTE